jgi:hypothetical protein
MTGNVLLPGCRERPITLGDGYGRHRSGLWLPPAEDTVPAPERQPVGVDLFAGAGGFSCGFKQAGWHVAAALEGWATAACTYLLNLGGPSTVVIPIGERLPEGNKRETKWHAAHRDRRVPVNEFMAMMARNGSARRTIRATSSCSSSCASSARSTQRPSAWRTCPAYSTWSPRRESR